jgi:phage terminase small subunit
MKLTPKQEKFCQVYIETGNATEAYRQAYDCSKWNETSIGQQGSKSLNNPKIAARVAELRQRLAERFEVEQGEVIKEYVRIGFSDIRRMFNEKGNLKSIHELDDDTAAAVSSVEVVTKQVGDGEVEHIHKIRLWPKNQALDSLSKHLGLFKEDNNQKGAAGKTEVNIKIELPTDIKEMMEFKHDAQTTEK